MIGCRKEGRGWMLGEGKGLIVGKMEGLVRLVVI